MDDRLTDRTDDELIALQSKTAGELTFNELIALAGVELTHKAFIVRHSMGNSDKIDVIDAGRDCSMAHTSLEDALMRYNSACYRINGTWKRMDPDSQRG